MHQPTPEQAAIIDSVAHCNTVVNSVAGSGKTTTNLHIAKRYDDKHILLLTYNRRLRAETITRAKSHSIFNIEVHTYHSFAVRYLARTCFNDKALYDALSEVTTPLTSPAYDMIIVDEAQDMTPIYFRLLRRICALNSCARLVIVGDECQSIYAFNEADSRYITLAHRLLPGPWAHLQCKGTWRVPPAIAQFVNDGLFGREKLVSLQTARPEHEVRYVICDAYSATAMAELSRLLGRFAPGDIFVLAPTVRSDKCPVRQLANNISAQGVQIFVPTDDSTAPSDDEIRGKLVFSTFHQVKGLERPAVLVFGVDRSYNALYERGLCPNEVYVAFTRASCAMTIIHHYMYDFLLGLSVPRRMLVIERGLDLGRPLPVRRCPSGVTDLLRHLSLTAVRRLRSMCTAVQIVPPGDRISPSGTADREGVSEITGTAIPLYYEWKTTGGLRAVKGLRVVSGRIDYKPAWTSPATLPIRKLLTCATKNCAAMSQYIFKRNQIANYDWLSEKSLAACMARMTQCGRGSFEVQVAHKGVYGFIDMYSCDNIVWEFKCTSELSDEHILQTALYLWLWRGQQLTQLLMDDSDIGVDVTEARSRIEATRAILFNIFTGEQVEVQAATDELVDALRAHKMAAMATTPDDEFIRTNKSIV